MIEIAELPANAGELETADWSILEEPGVMDAASRAARKVATQYEKTAEYDDLLQEAYVALATRSRQMRRALTEGGLGRLHHALWCDLTNLANSQARRVSRNTSYEANLAQFDPEGM